MKKHNDHKTYFLNYLHKYFSRPRYVKCRDIKLHINTNKFTPKVINAFHSGRFERDEKDILLSTLEPSDRYLEIGAGVGYTGLYAATIVSCSDHVVLFEANPDMIPIIETNMELNDQTLSVYNNAVISGESAEVPFYITNDFWLSSTFDTKSARKITIEAQSLETTLANHQPTYLMLDVEGGEYDLLARSELTNSVRKICFEIHPQVISSNKISKIFERLFADDFTVDFNQSSGNVYYMYRQG